MDDESWLQEEILKFRRRLGETVRDWREKEKMSQDDFADLAGISRPAVSSFELGEKEPKIGTMICSARAMGEPLVMVILKAIWRMNRGLFLATLSTMT